MSDQSYLDERYFVDEYVYNCPFCNRRHVSYSVRNKVSFNWRHDKPCYVYIVCCHSCKNESLHLCFGDLRLSEHNYGIFDSDVGSSLDELFFYSVPTSFFNFDSRVPRILRELLTEAEGCLKSNFLTGASACARKLVYEFASLSRVSGINYNERIKSLQEVYPSVDSTYFDSLLTIQKATSSKIHENSYDGWKAEHLRLILASLHEVLHEVYVTPALRDDRRKSILTLKDEVLGAGLSSDARPE